MHIVNTIVVDDLATPRANTSGATVLTKFAKDDLDPT